MTRKGKRLLTIGSMLGVVGAAAGLVLFAFSSSISLFSSPTELAARPPSAEQRIRLGGLVEKGSVERHTGDVVRFRVTDTVESIAVVYHGILPDLFREEQGIVAEGTLGPGRVFTADAVLAKHDETYMPKEVVDDLKARGLWEDGRPKPANAPPKIVPVAAATGAGA